jgi:hypothetical protein
MLGGFVPIDIQHSIRGIGPGNFRTEELDDLPPREKTLGRFRIGELKGPLSAKFNAHVQDGERQHDDNFHISEISTTRKVCGVVDCFSAQSYNRFAKAFTSSES